MTQATKQRLLIESIDTRLLQVRKLLASFNLTDATLIDLYSQDLADLTRLRIEIAEGKKIHNYITKLKS